MLTIPYQTVAIAAEHSVGLTSDIAIAAVDAGYLILSHASGRAAKIDVTRTEMLTEGTGFLQVLSMFFDDAMEQCDDGDVGHEDKPMLLVDDLLSPSDITASWYVELNDNAPVGTKLMPGRFKYSVGFVNIDIPVAYE